MASRTPLDQGLILMVLLKHWRHSSQGRGGRGGQSRRSDQGRRDWGRRQGLRYRRYNRSYRSRRRSSHSRRGGWHRHLRAPTGRRCNGCGRSSAQGRSRCRRGCRSDGRSDGRSGGRGHGRGCSRGCGPNADRAGRRHRDLPRRGGACSQGREQQPGYRVNPKARQAARRNRCDRSPSHRAFLLWAMLDLYCLAFR